ncbi:MAG: hypothetical protein K0S12_45 [Bacteroidetes bacterium]|jgi:hypothetical protein|nr:hypothetical protein [Bacteroidota bacterium]
MNAIPQHEIIKQVQINEATISLRADGIVTVFLHKNMVLDLALQMLMLNIYNEITEGKKHPFLFEASTGIKVTKEAKENAIRIEPLAPGSAYAIVAKSKAYQILANFYLTIKKTHSPYRVFTDRDKAIEWLHTYL